MTKLELTELLTLTKGRINEAEHILLELNASVCRQTNRLHFLKESYELCVKQLDLLEIDQ